MSKIKEIQKNIYVVDNRESLEDSIQKYKDSLFYNMLMVNTPAPNSPTTTEENMINIYKKTISGDIDKLIEKHKEKNLFWGELMIDNIPDLDNISDTLKKKIIKKNMLYTLYITGTNNKLTCKVGKTVLCNSLEEERGIITIPMRKAHIIHIIRVFETEVRNYEEANIEINKEII